MFRTKLNKPKSVKDVVTRLSIVEKLEENNHLPFILVSAPAGFGKSTVISQWLDKIKPNFAWLSLDDTLNKSDIFISYLIEMIESTGYGETEKFIQLKQERHFLSWDTIISLVVNIVNEFQQRTIFILDDYYLIKSQKIHELVEALITEDLGNLQLVIVTRWDPPFQFRERRLYQKMLDIRMQDLKFEEHEINLLLSNNTKLNLSNSEIKALTFKTEGWILAIRMVLLAKLHPQRENKKLGADILTNDLDRLMLLISENLDPNIFRQMQLCALFDTFDAGLIDAICTYAFSGACKAEVFLSKVNALNFFLIPTHDEGTWYRFHHLFGDILKRHLVKHEPNIIKPIYSHISSWLAEKGMIDEAIKYAVRAENLDLACNLIIEHKNSAFNRGDWWVVQSWLENIPEPIKNSNIDLLLADLRICEDTWNIEDIFSILNMLKMLNIENSDARSKSDYYFHLGYYFTFIQPDAKKAVEYLEQSKLIYHDETMFSARREAILAIARQMYGHDVLALTSLENIEKQFHPSSLMYLRSLDSRVFIHLLNGEMTDALIANERFYFSARNCGYKTVEAFSWYFKTNLAFQTCKNNTVESNLNGTLLFKGMLNYRMYFDALAGLILCHSFKGEKKKMEDFLNKMYLEVSELRDKNFIMYYQSVKARVNWHNKDGHKYLGWAQKDWMKQPVASYFFLMDVPDLTKLRILVSHGSVLQVEEALKVLKEVENSLNTIHNSYHIIDIEIIRAMALRRLGNITHAENALTKAMLLSEKSEITRPVVEAYHVMPSLFNLIDTSNKAHRVLGHNGLIVSEPIESVLNSDLLTRREQEIVDYISNGFRNKEIADQLNIATVTVKSHLTNIYKKLDVRNRTSMLKKVSENTINF